MSIGSNQYIIFKVILTKKDESNVYTIDIDLNEYANTLKGECLTDIKTITADYLKQLNEIVGNNLEITCSDNDLINE